jgi:hypothetical protein
VELKKIWLWIIHHPVATQDRRSTTAKAQFEVAWRRWLVWAKLVEMPAVSGLVAEGGGLSEPSGPR